MMLEPPCSSMSLARKPGLRSSRVPWGFDLFLLKDGRGLAVCSSMPDAGGFAVDGRELLLFGTTPWRFHELVSFLVDFTIARGLWTGARNADGYGRRTSLSAQSPGSWQS